MAGMNLPLGRAASPEVGRSVGAPRFFMSWEDWLTFGAAFIAFVAVAVSIQQAKWVPNFPELVPTAIFALLIGMVAARVRFPAVIVHAVGLLLGAVVVVLAVQGYADGATLGDRLHDFQARMHEWFEVVRANDISNDNLPFVTLVHSISFLAIYTGSYVIYRWHNPWVALLPASIVLLANIAFLDGQPSAAFVVFLFGAILLVARLHVQKNQESWRRDGVEYPEFMSLGITQLAVFLAFGLMLAAWLIPLGTQASAVESVYQRLTGPFDGQSERLVRLFHNIDSRKGADLHTFGSTLPLQGNVKLGDKEVLEVRASEPGLIRATSYEIYTGNGWKAGDRDSQRVNSGELAASPEAAQYEARNVTSLEITVLDKQGVVLTPGMPLGSNRDVTIETPNGYQGDIEQIRLRSNLGQGDTYNSLGSQSVATDEQLRSAGTEYPEWVDRYLQLPDGLPQRVRDESARVAEGAATPYDQALAIEEYLRGFPYSLNVETAPPRQDAVDYYLFELKQGYFDFNSTAMAVMLRTLGIPARVAVGYALDPSLAGQETYTVRKDNAYSWVEVWFPTYGWVNFNPTPDRPSGGAGGIGSGGGAATWAPDGLDGLDLSELFGPHLDEAGGPILPQPVQDVITQEPVTHSSPPWFLIWTLTALLAAAAIAAIAARVTWNWGLGGLDSRSRLWAKAHRLAGWAGLGGAPEETPREWSQRVGSVVAREDEARQFAQAYEEARYGRPDHRRIDEEATVGSYRKLRNALFAKLLRRKEPGDRKRRRSR